MKTLTAIVLFALSAFAFAETGPMHDHSQHPKHNMVLYGESVTYASHIVYKAPHNFQVILEVSIPEEAKQKYLAARKEKPEATFILLLDPLDIAKIDSLSSTSGRILREEEDGTRTEIAAPVLLPRQDYRIVFFNELPLSLSGSTPER